MKGKTKENDEHTQFTWHQQKRILDRSFYILVRKIGQRCVGTKVPTASEGRGDGHGRHIRGALALDRKSAQIAPGEMC